MTNNRQMPTCKYCGSTNVISDAYPAMLEALERVSWYLDKEDDQNIVTEVEAAIAKARETEAP